MKGDQRDDENRGKDGRTLRMTDGETKDREETGPAAQRRHNAVWMDGRGGGD